MRPTSLLTLATLILASAAGMAQDKAPATTRTLNVKLHYTGSGTVDDKHHIIVFLFDSPDFTKGQGMPIAAQHATAKDGTVSFSDLDKSPVYAAAVYDPTGAYEGMSPPPSGASLGMYMKTPPEPAPVNIEPGKKADIDLPFDDSQRNP